MNNDDMRKAAAVSRYEWIIQTELPHTLRPMAEEIDKLAEELDAAVGGGLTYWPAGGMSTKGEPTNVAVFVHIRNGQLSDREKELVAQAIMFWAKKWGSSGAITTITPSYGARLMVEPAPAPEPPAHTALGHIRPRS